ncbi:MAG TPA: hypothetical protein VKZ63_04260, partial [Kofleriaceae bacterium]|nr:hypothetical protein [Kofleriaceae bacterium]
PAMGCFALVQRADAAGAKEAAVAEAMVAELAESGLEAEVDGDSISLAGDQVSGRVRTILDGGQGAALSAACFYNRREPERCRVRCDALLDSLGRD